MRNLTEQEIKNIKVLTHYPEWVTYYSVLGDFINALNDISDVDINNVDRIAPEVIGRRIFKDKFRDFLSSIDIISKSDKEIVDKTFE